ncbi:LD-carboxypeptidase [Bdellovibrionales bacterium]|nr:LD-carboxypeptidase [Bdellovibrionales bacterium]
MWNEISYPKPLESGSTIGVTAPSSGVPSVLHPRLDLVLEHLIKRGYKYKEGRCLREDFKSVSADAKSRATDFMSLWSDNEVDAIVPPWGGELLINMFPFLDFEKISENPKWLLGYSDTSTLLFAITMRTGISTAHGLNLMDTLQIEQNDPLSSQTYEILSKPKGSHFKQLSSDLYQTQFEDFGKNIEATFNLVHKTEWKSLNEKDAEFSGRIIGGCLDTLRNLVGTPYGNVNEFASNFQEDGLILYFENAEGTPPEVCRMLWNMKLAGWFEMANGFVFGRSAGKDTNDEEELSYKDALVDALGDLDLPVVFDADIGHRPPQMTILNGSFAEVKFSNGKGILNQTLR